MLKNIFRRASAAQIEGLNQGLWQPEPQITVQVSEGPLGTRIFSYAWDGPRDGVVRLSEVMLMAENVPIPKPGRVFRIGTNAMRRLLFSKQFWGDPRSFEAMRVDTGMWTYLRYLIPAFLGWHLSQLKYRIILTLTVWGLAAYSSGRYPKWSDVYLLRKIAALWRKGFRQKGKTE